MTEPILVENKDRFVLFPIKHKNIWEMYKKAEASFWTAEEIDLSADMVDWDAKLNNEKNKLSATSLINVLRCNMRLHSNFSKRTHNSFSIEFIFIIPLTLSFQ